jgi:hypothetical protein
VAVDGDPGQQVGLRGEVHVQRTGAHPRLRGDVAGRRAVVTGRGEGPHRGDEQAPCRVGPHVRPQLLVDIPFHRVHRH